MPWKPGQSGNPSGRKRSTKEQLEALSEARKGSAKAMRKAVEWLDSDDPRLATAAMKVLLEYGLGKPVQVVDQTVRTEQPEDLSPQERIAALERALVAERKAEEQRAEGVH